MRHAPVSVVVPMRDEAASLPGLLDGLAQQETLPAELIFVDTGSRDGSAERVRAWWAGAGWTGASCRVIEEHGAYPGGGRNAGVRASSQPWVAFIDCGIVPESRWLQSLLECAGRGDAAGALGICSFEATDAWPRAFCALSYGVGTRRPILAASIFRRPVFDRAGLFDPALRAGEDIEWLKRASGTGQTLPVCEAAQAVYRQFPGSAAAAAGKWYAYERSISAAGIGGWGRRLAMSAVLLLYVLPWAVPAAGGALWLAYFALRCLADPIRRSTRRAWWSGAPLALACLPFAALAVDTGRALGSLAGIVSRAPRG
jgi:glycosyltransferase involved in cell wall biosynthesis